MDPLSIATATITIISAVSVSIRFVKKIHGSPKEILKLGDEILDLENVVCEVTRALENGKTGKLSAPSYSSAKENVQLSDQQHRNTTRLLLRTQHVLNQLVDIFDKRLSVPTNEAVAGKTSRWAWLKYRSKIEELREELSGLKLSLSTIVGAATLSEVKEILLRLDGLVVVDQGSMTSQTGPQKLTSFSRSDTTRIREKDFVPVDVEDATDADSSTLSDTTDHDSFESSKSRHNVATKVDSGLPAISLRSQGRSAPSISVVSSVRHDGTSNRCSPLCSCVCHRPITLSSPSVLSQLLGTLSIKYSSVLLPFSNVPPCTEKLCRPRQESKRKITYRFPQWLVSKAVTMVLNSSLPEGPQMHLRIQAVRPASDDIFRLSSLGDLVGLQALFTTGKASIYDVDDRGWTALHKAFLLGNSPVVSFLLDAGADACVEAANGSSVVDRAWYYDRTGAELSKPFSSANDRILRNIDLDEFLPSKQYTVLHKIVLGLVPNADLATQLQMSTSLIDVPDSEGRTPLWWASACGDTQAVKTLLDYGATIYKRGFDLFGPLHVAQKPEIVRLLLAAGVDVDTRDTSGRTALHCCCYRGSKQGGSISLMRTLLDAGADINAQTIHKNTPLHFAAMYSWTEYIVELLQRGADIESLRLDKELHSDPRYKRYRRHPAQTPTISDSGAHGVWDGTTPLSTAVYFAQAASVRILLRHGADVTKKTRSQITLLHLAAINGNVSTIEALTEARLKGLDPNARDVTGSTPEECLRQRVDYNESLGRAFRRLLTSLRKKSDEGRDGLDERVGFAESKCGQEEDEDEDEDDNDSTLTPITTNNDDEDEDEDDESFEDAVQDLTEK